jgi:predicted ATPase/DNA-binding winged helix-turn-helix (wHTH) protein
MIRTAMERQSGTSVPAQDQVLVFGRFRLDVSHRRLFLNGQQVRVGSRAMTILVVLAQHAGRIVSKRELQKHVWPHTVVEDGTLRVHIAALRKILGRTADGARYVENISGHGYCLVLPEGSVARQSLQGTGSAMRASTSAMLHPPVLPASNQIVGRDEVIAKVAFLLEERRLVTLSGAGGVGKTTVAAGVLETSASRYAHASCFVDLVAVKDPGLVPDVVATALGLAAGATDALSAILAFLRHRSCLVVLDNCEHVIDGAAQLAQAVFESAPGVHLLATSREPLYARGELVHRLAPLETPPADSVQSPEQLMGYPAVQLFLNRARASGDIELQVQDLPAIAGVCQRLEGNPLAIEIAAGRVNLLGLRTLMTSLEERLQLPIAGSRATVERHRTLRNCFDWSYELLSPAEQLTFRRLAVFCDRFDLEAATAVLTDELTSAAAAFEAVLSLMSKSLVTAEVAGESCLYRLSHTARTYALGKLREAGEPGAVKSGRTQLPHQVGGLHQVRSLKTLGVAGIHGG